VLRSLFPRSRHPRSRSDLLCTAGQMPAPSFPCNRWAGLPMTPRELLPKGSSDAIGKRLYLTRALSSAVEHTLYMGEVARSIRAAPTIALLLARQGAGPAGDD
jgi:hypothetical protein